MKTDNDSDDWSRVDIPIRRPLVLHVSSVLLRIQLPALERPSMLIFISWGRKEGWGRAW